MARRKQAPVAKKIKSPRSASTPKNAGAKSRIAKPVEPPVEDETEEEQGSVVVEDSPEETMNHNEDEVDSEEEDSENDEEQEQQPSKKSGKLSNTQQSKKSTSGRSSVVEKSTRSANATMKKSRNTNEKSKNSRRSSIGNGKRKQRKRGTRALQEIRYFQQTTHLLISKLPFGRVCKEIAQEISPGVRFRTSSMECLQTAAEAFLVRYFEDASLCTLHARRKTLMVNDLHLVRRLVLDR